MNRNVIGKSIDLSLVNRLKHINVIFHSDKSDKSVLRYKFGFSLLPNPFSMGF